jgi:hypothetical protein
MVGDAEKFRGMELEVVEVCELWWKGKIEGVDLLEIEFSYLPLKQEDAITFLAWYW